MVCVSDDGIRLVGTEWTVSVSETRSLGDYENTEPFVSVSGEIPADVGQLDAETRRELKARLLSLHKELQETVERAADNRVKADGHEDWGVPENGGGDE